MKFLNPSARIIIDEDLEIPNKNSTWFPRDPIILKIWTSWFYGYIAFLISNLQHGKITNTQITTSRQWKNSTFQKKVFPEKEQKPPSKEETSSQAYSLLPIGRRQECSDVYGK